MTRVLVCGGRHWNDQKRINEVLDHLHSEIPFSVLIQGGQKTAHMPRWRNTFYGADYQARTWAENRGIPMIEERAKWDEHGNAAGPIRNRLMLAKHKPDFGVAFKHRDVAESIGADGTAHMVRIMRAAGLVVLEFDHA